MHHPDYPSLLDDQANALHTRFEHLEDLADFERVVKLHKKALVLRPPGHPMRSSSLNHLGCTFQSRFERLGVWADLEMADQLYKEGHAALPPDDPERYSSLVNIAATIRRLCELQGDLADSDRLSKEALASIFGRTPPPHSGQGGQSLATCGPADGNHENLQFAETF